MPATNLPGGLGISADTRDNLIDSLVNRAGWKLQSITFTPKLVATTAAQDTGITAPASGFPLVVGVKVNTAEVTGTTKTIDVGLVVGGSDVLVNGAPVNNVGTFNPNSNTALFSTGSNITYSLGSADFAELDCEVFILWVCTDG